MENKEEFSALNLQKVEFEKKEANIYYVFKNQNEYVEVKADTAFDALNQSKIVDPDKIVHFEQNTKFILKENEIVAVGNHSTKEEINDTKQASSETTQEKPLSDHTTNQ